MAMPSVRNARRGKQKNRPSRKEVKRTLSRTLLQPYIAQPCNRLIDQGRASGAMLKRASASFPPVESLSQKIISVPLVKWPPAQYRTACARIWAMTERRWLRTEQAAVYAKVGVAFIRKLIRNRQLRAICRRYYVIDRL